MGDDTSVRVAVRIRPQLGREKIDNCRICTSVTPGEPQVVLGNDKAFTFDTVFDFNSGQQEVFEAHAKELIDGCFDGYNATILAYGQTGSGKTHSMGTGFDVTAQEEDLGIIPRAVRHLFNGINDRKQNSNTASTFQVFAEFLELYNEDIYDLFDASSAEGKRQKSSIKIHEDSNGTIYTQGVALKAVSSYDETMERLQSGALSRTTASTNMNSQSSRSHAIFTLHIKQTRAVHPSNMSDSTEGEKELDTQTLEFETLSAKFNFVDLAGSERLKRTGATGDRAKEGISINCGLLALGNVISALGDVQKKGSHVPYRDSKLTRLLQDSLGGNSRTVMMACISPSDRDFMETLNTLKYANRARNIKNRVVVNQDKTSKQLTELRAQLQSLQLELQEYKQGKRIVGPDGVESINDMFHENSLLQDENEKLRSRVKVLQDTIESMKSCNEAASCDRAALILSSVSGDNVNKEMKTLITGFTSEIECLKVKLFESEAQVKQIKRSHTTPSRLMMSPSTPRADSSMLAAEENAMSILELAKQDVERSKTALKTKITRSESMDETTISQSCNDDSAEADSGEHEADDDLDDDQSDDSEPLPEIGDSEQDSEDEQRDKDSEKLQEDLAEISSEISIKQKMIEELEKSQRQLQNIRQHYEDKLRNLQDQIKSVERERDQVLNSLGDRTKQSQEQVQKIKSEFEKRITDMQTELKKVSAAKREHAKMMKNQAVYDKKIKELNSELNDMKKSKVRMMTQMKSESEKNKLSDQKKNKELLQLRKEKRLRENQLKTLQLQNRQKDAILKSRGLNQRKHEEVSQLRRKQREGSAAARVTAKNRVNSTQHSSRSSAKSKSNKLAEPVFSPRVAKSKWDKLEHYISSVIMRKQTISSMEVEMDLFLTKREELSKKIERYMKRLDLAMHHNDLEGATDLEDQLEAMNIKLNYLQSNVSDCQNQIMQMEEEAKDESVLSVVLSCMTLEEAKYLLEHLVSLTLSKGMDFTQKDIAFKELSARYEKVNMDSRLRDQLLQQMLAESGVTLQEFHDFDTDDVSGEASTSNSNRSSPLIGDHGDQMWADRPREKSCRKARRRTATASDLLGTNASEKPLVSPQSPLASGSPLGSKPAINIADIIPPAPKGPPPGRGMPPPSNSIETIEEEPEDQPEFDTSELSTPRTQLLRSGSYTVLNSTTPNKPMINGTTTKQIMNGRSDLHVEDLEPERYTDSRESSPYPDLELSSSKALSGSYTVVSGEIRLDCNRSTINNNQPTVTDSGEPGVDNSISKPKKVPPKIPPKPIRPTSLNSASSTISTASITINSAADVASPTSVLVNPAPLSGSLSMTKWKGISSRRWIKTFRKFNLDAADTDTSAKIVEKPPSNQNASPVCSEPRDSTGRVIGRRKMAPPNASPSLRRKMFNSTVNGNSNSSNKFVSTIQEVHEPSSTPPSSPSLRRKQIMSTSLEGENVFMRLTGQTNTNQTINRRVNVPGTIQGKTDKSVNTNQGLVLVKQAVGHSKPVLSVCSTEELLFTASKDQTCKVWDLNIGCELMSLEDHPNYVTTVRYCPNNKLVYSVSNSFIKVWDLRARGKCVKVLSSSGLVHDSIPLEPASGSQAILQQGEQHIFDIWVGAGSDINSIYSTTGSTVRVWDIRMFIATGKVASGHQAPIKCLTVNNTTSGHDLITGSKDHFIKLFDMNSDSGGVIQPRHTLSPPHYDGVECLVQRGTSLFSGSRDMSIKLWNLDSLTLQQTVNGAHKDWITDMCLLPDNDILISSCRGGIVKLWSTESCTQLDEVKAHCQSVHGLTANSSHLFTASSDNTVGIWKINAKLLS